jgi:flagellar motor switch protein FliM
MEQKNKGGRPTKAEMAARGITKTELDVALRILKKIFGNAIDTMIEISDDVSLTIKERFRMKQELVNMYHMLYKSDIAIKMQLAKGTDSEEDTSDKPLAPVFNFAK